MSGVPETPLDTPPEGRGPPRSGELKTSAQPGDSTSTVLRDLKIRLGTYLPIGFPNFLDFFSGDAKIFRQLSK